MTNGPDTCYLESLEHTNTANVSGRCFAAAVFLTRHPGLGFWRETLAGLSVNVRTFSRLAPSTLVEAGEKPTGIPANNVFTSERDGTVGSGGATAKEALTMTVLRTKA